MSALYEVAEHLSDRASKEVGLRADAFGRSAFNRYYYATFLSVRELLFTLDKSWAKEPHATMPDLLEGAVLKQLKQEAKRQQLKGLRSSEEARSLIKRAASSASEIASVLRVAYLVRVAADYELDKVVIFDANGFLLAQHSSAEAKRWKHRVDQMKGALLSVCKELAIV